MPRTNRPASSDAKTGNARRRDGSVDPDHPRRLTEQSAVFLQKNIVMCVFEVWIAWTLDPRPDRQGRAYYSVVDHCRTTNESTWLASICSLAVPDWEFCHESRGLHVLEKQL